MTIDLLCRHVNASGDHTAESGRLAVR